MILRSSVTQVILPKFIFKGQACHIVAGGIDNLCQFGTGSNHGHNRERLTTVLQLPSISMSIAVDSLHIEPDISRAWSLPSRFYTDASIFELEKERIFARTWQVVGHG